MNHVTRSIHRGQRTNKTKMAAAFQKRRAGLVAILKHSLATMAPALYNEGLISDKDRETAMDDSVSKRERAESLVATLETKIQVDEEVLKEFLKVLREVGVGHTYVMIVENDLRNPQRSSSAVSGRKEDTPTHTITPEVQAKNEEVTQTKNEEVSSQETRHITHTSEQRQEAELVSQIEPLQIREITPPRFVVDTSPSHSEGSPSPSPTPQLGLEDLQTVSIYLKPLQHYELLRLGRELHMNYDNLLVLKNSHTQPESMLTAMLEVWLTSEEEGLKHYPPSWRRLSVGLRNVGLSFIARKIVRDKIRR